MEIFEELVLAIAATAYQAARGRRPVGPDMQAARDRFLDDAASTLGGPQLVADSAMFNGWLPARAAYNEES